MWDGTCRYRTWFGTGRFRSRRSHPRILPLLADRKQNGDSKQVLVANGQGFWGDSILGPVRLVQAIKIV